MLYLRTLVANSRKLFGKNYKGHSALTEKGFTIQSSKCGPKAENYIRKILKEDDWQCSDLLALKRFKERVEEQEDTLRIRWESHKNGMMNPTPANLKIR